MQVVLKLLYTYLYINNNNNNNNYNNNMTAPQVYPVDKILSGNSLTFEINLQNITKLFGYLTPENAIYVFRHQGFDGVTSHTEKWYGTKYNEHYLKPEQVGDNEKSYYHIVYTPRYLIILQHMLS
jgi:predicted ATPase